MKKRIVVVLCLALFAAVHLTAQVEEVFAPGSYQFGGSARFTRTSHEALRELSEDNDKRTTTALQLSPSFGRFVSDGVYFGFSPSLMYTRDKYLSEQDDQETDRVFHNMRLGLGLSTSRYFYGSSVSAGTWVPELFASTGIEFLIGLEDKVADQPIQDERRGFGFNAGLGLRSHYFVTERVSFAVGAAMRYELRSFDNLLRDNLGESVERDESAFNFGSFIIEAIAGVYWFLPPRQSFQIGNRESSSSARAGTADSWTSVPGFPSDAVYFGGTLDGLPDGDGTLLFANGGSYVGRFVRGAFDGDGRLMDAHGRFFSGSFRGGQPHGDGVYFDGQDTVQVSYRNGTRVDEAFLGTMAVLEERIAELETEIGPNHDNAVEAVRARANDVVELIQQMSTATSSQSFFLQFDIADTTYNLQAGPDDLVLSRLSVNVTRDESGEVVEIERRDSQLGITSTGLSIRQTDETITRIENPVDSVRTGLVNLGTNISVADSYSNFGLSAAIGVRNFANRGNPLPGPSGGSGSGFDWRLMGSAQLSVVSYEVVDFDSFDPWSGSLPTEQRTITGLNLGGSASIGWTRYRFQPMNPDDLTQSGRGMTFGIQGTVLAFLGGIASEVPGMNQVLVVPAPMVTFDRYRFNPATAKYSVRSLFVFIWPAPFTASVAYSFSL